VMPIKRNGSEWKNQLYPQVMGEISCTCAQWLGKSHINAIQPTSATVWATVRAVGLDVAPGMAAALATGVSAWAASASAAGASVWLASALALVCQRSW